MSSSTNWEAVLQSIIDFWLPTFGWIIVIIIVIIIVKFLKNNNK